MTPKKQQGQGVELHHDSDHHFNPKSATVSVPRRRWRRPKSQRCHCCDGEFPFCWHCRCGFEICQACMDENIWGMSCNHITWQIRQLFTNCIEASEILGVDADMRETLRHARNRLPPLQIGKHGQLQEWIEDYDEAVPGHRHMAHMLAVYPFEAISPEATPALARAARVTIARRHGAVNMEDHGWSRALAFVCLARLGDREAAYQNLQLYMGKFLHDNLLGFAWGGHTGTRYPIFCLDGNGGVAVGIAEMLMQHRGDVIVLLPALPNAWPSGHVTGLCAPGGFEVDQYWQGGALQRAVIRAKLARPCTVASPVPLQVESDNQPVELETIPPATIRFPAAPGKTYVLTPKP